MKRIWAFLLTAVLLLSMTFSCTVSAADLPQITLSDASGKPGDTVSLTISTDKTLNNIVGMRFKLAYDTSQLKFENKSAKILQSSIDPGLTNKGISKNGMVYFTYTGDITSPVKVVSGGIVSLDFTVIASDSEYCEVTLTVEELYADRLENVEIADKTHTARITVSQSTVGAVIAAIDGIGTVTYPDSYDVLTAARSAYNSLTRSEKLAVTNLDKLIAAEQEYLRQKTAAETAENAAAADRWRNGNAAVLSKQAAYSGENALTLNDREAVTAAINSYNSQAPAVRALLNNEINYLNKLKKYFAVLESIAQAQETIKSFDDNYGLFYGFTADTVSSDELTGLGYAVEMINNIYATFSDIPDWLKENFESKANLIKSLYEKARQISMYENSDATKAYNSYMDSYGSWIAKTDSQVTRDDILDLSLAIQAYELLSDDAKKLVGEELYKHLQSLKEYAENIEEDTEEGEDTDSGIDYIGQLEDGDTDSDPDEEPDLIQSDTAAQKDAARTLVRVSTKGISVIVWVLLISFGFLLILLAAMFVSQYFLNKRLKNFREGGASDGEVLA